MPKQINTPAPGQGLVRAFALKGRYQPVLDETIVPVTIVPLEAPPTRKLAQWGIDNAASGAGNQNNAFFTNPPTSNTLMVITEFWGITTAALTDHFHVTLGDAVVTTAPAAWRDSRHSGAPLAALTMSAAASAVVIGARYVSDGTVYSVEHVLAPGSGLRVRQEAVNQVFAMNWIWYEIPLTTDTLL